VFSDLLLEVVKEGRILFAGLVGITTKHHQFDSGIFWSILGHFFRKIKDRVGKG
jgi:hypothetical protein